MALATLDSPHSVSKALASLHLSGETAKAGIDLHLLVQHATSPGSDPDRPTTMQHIRVFPGETIRDVRLRLRNKSWFNTRHALIFGERELLEHEVVGDLARALNAADSNYKSIFCRMSDVEAVNVSTLKREAALSATKDSLVTPRSTLSSLLSTGAGGASAAAASAAAVAPAPGGGGRGVGVEDDGSRLALVTAAPPPTPGKERTVVHLRIHKSAKVAWRHMSEDDTFELSISCADTPEPLMQRLEAVSADGVAATTQLMLMGAGDAAAAARGALPASSAPRPLLAYGTSRTSAELALLPVEPQNAASFPDGSPLLSSPEHELHQNWLKARQGLSQGAMPTLAPAGTGGSYFLQDGRGVKVAVFKPEDEEPLAVNNPKGNTPGTSSSAGSWPAAAGAGGSTSSRASSPGGAAGGGSHGSPNEGLRKGTRPGEGAVREVAAYLLDHDRFAGVPPTAYVSWRLDAAHGDSAKKGSLQQYVEAEGDCEERGPSLFTVAQVHKICVLDIRLANTDRNGGNILVRRPPGGGPYELVPIDHGYCLPASFEDISFEWLYWAQAKVPFEEATLDYIARLDAEQDIAILQAHAIRLRPECCRVLRVCTMLLQKAAARRLTPYHIGCIMSRQALTKSPLEKLHHHAAQLATATGSGGGDALDEAAYLRAMSGLMDEYLEELALDNDEDIF